MDALSFQNHLPFDVDYDKDDGDSKKTEGCVEGAYSGEHREDFFKVKSPEDVDEKDYANDGEYFFPIHRCAVGCMSLLVYVDFASLKSRNSRYIVSKSVWIFVYLHHAWKSTMKTVLFLTILSLRGVKIPENGLFTSSCKNGF